MSTKLRITIDPGHGERDNSYPPVKGFFEGTQMWKLAGFLRSELERRGFEVVTTRPLITDNPSVDSRGRAAAANKSVLFLSLHSNATADTTQTTVTGSEVYLSIKGREHKPLADKLLAAVCRVMNHSSRGVKERTLDNNAHNDYYGVIRSAANGGCTCAMLMEHGFHTNPTDAAFLTVDSNLRRLAEAEAEVISKHFGVEPEKSIVPLTTKDALLALRAAAGLEILTAEQAARLDVDKDGKVTTSDALIILQIEAGLSPYGKPAAKPEEAVISDNVAAGDMVIITQPYAGSAYDAVARNTTLVGQKRIVIRFISGSGVNFPLQLGVNSDDTSSANTSGFAKVNGVKKI